MNNPIVSLHFSVQVVTLCTGDTTVTSRVAVPRMLCNVTVPEAAFVGRVGAEACVMSTSMSVRTPVSVQQQKCVWIARDPTAASVLMDTRETPQEFVKVNHHIILTYLLSQQNKF